MCRQNVLSLLRNLSSKRVKLRIVEHLFLIWECGLTEFSEAILLEYI